MTQTLIAVSLQELKMLVREAVRDELNELTRTAPQLAKTWLTTDELAKHFHVCGRTVLYWVQNRGCPHYMVGSRRRFDLAAVERWIGDRVDGRTVPEPPANNPHSRRVEV